MKKVREENVDNVRIWACEAVQVRWKNSSSGEMQFSCQTDISKNAQERGERISEESSMGSPMHISYSHVSSDFHLTSFLKSVHPLFNVQNSFRCNCLLRWSLDDAEHCGLWFDSDCHNEGASRLLESETCITLLPLSNRLLFLSWMVEPWLGFLSLLWWTSTWCLSRSIPLS